jgi:site-specific recombinase XerD
MAISSLPIITVVHNFKNTPRKDGKAPICIRFYFPDIKKNRYINTGMYVQPKYWDDGRNDVKGSHPRHYYFSRELRNLLTQYQDYIYELDKQGRAVTPQLIKEYGQPITVSFTDFYRQMIEKKRKQYSDNTYKDYLHCHRRLCFYKEKIEFTDITMKFLEDYKSFLFDDDLAPNTVKKHLKRIRTCVNFAIKYQDGCPITQQNNPFHLFNIPSAPTHPVWLNEDELRQMEQLTFDSSERHLQLIRDTFLFQCYTGLRFSDVHNLSAVEISDTADGILLYRTAKKNQKQINLPLWKLFPSNGSTESRPERILRERLAALQPFLDTEKGKRLPMFEGKCLQYVNRELKKIATRIDGRNEVRRKLTTHAGRHTFGTYMAQRVPITALQQMMQHAKVETTQRYIHITGASVNRSLDDVDWN